MKYKFDRFDMMKLGLFFETESEFDLFIDVITEEYEISIGEAIAAYVDAGTLEFFNDDALLRGDALVAQCQPLETVAFKP